MSNFTLHPQLEKDSLFINQNVITSTSFHYIHLPSAHQWCNEKNDAMNIHLWDWSQDQAKARGYIKELNEIFSFTVIWTYNMVHKNEKLWKILLIVRNQHLRNWNLKQIFFSWLKSISVAELMIICLNCNSVILASLIPAYKCWQWKQSAYNT